jgi:ABC-2 type transport system ATP-binding protein
MQNPLVLENFQKSYGQVQAVKGVTFDLRPGEIFGLLGPNGAGKTSIISCITTLEKPTGGVIKVFGHDVVKASRVSKSMVGCVPQEVINHGYFSVEEILHFHSGFFGLRNNHARIEELLKELRLSEHRHKKVKQLSGGMKRRLMIAKALVHSPKLLLLDEPTAGVDIELRDSLWAYVSKLRSEGTTILLTTHYLEEAERLCDRVAVINRGELLALEQTRALVEKTVNTGTLEDAVRHLLKNDAEKVVTR